MYLSADGDGLQVVGLVAAVGVFAANFEEPVARDSIPGGWRQDRILPYGVRRAENTKTTKKDKDHKEFIAKST